MSAPHPIRSIAPATDDAPVFHVRRFASFNFQRTEGDGAERPHRHEFHELIWIRRGSGQQLIDGTAVRLQSRMLSLILRGQVHQFVRASGLDGLVIRFTDELLPGDGFRIDALPPQLLRELDTANHKQRFAPDQARVIDALCDMVWAEHLLAGDGSGSRQALGHLVSMLLIHFQRARSQNERLARPAARHTGVYHQFMTLLEAEFCRHHEVSYYADRLHLTSRQLSQQVSQVLGMPAKRVIEQRLVTEAKRLFRFSDLSSKEIAYRLGYDDPAYFSRVFSRITRLSPRKYRYRIS